MGILCGAVDVLELQLCRVVFFNKLYLIYFVFGILAHSCFFYYKSYILGIGNVVVTVTNGCIDFILIYFLTTELCKDGFI